MSEPLYRISAAINEIEDLLELSGGEISDDVARALAVLSHEKAEKVSSIALWIHNLESDAEKIKIERVRLTARQEAIERRADSLRAYLLSCLSPGEKIKSHLFTISSRVSEAVEVDEVSLPNIYMRERVVRTPDKEALKNDLKQGATIPGAKLVQRRHLTLK